MPVSESSDPLPGAAESAPPVAIVAARFETKYLIARAEVPALCEQLKTRLASHHHSVPPGVASTGTPRHITTTVYFDTARRDLCRAAMRAPVHLKVRARTYHDEPAPPSALEAPVWIEIKERDGARSRKRRAPVERSVAARWFAALALADDEIARGACGASLAAYAEPQGHALLADLVHTRTALGAPLVPSCVVRYRREAFQDALGTLRITLDHEVRAFRAPSAPFGPSALVLDSPLYEEPACVLEAKSTGALPDWVSTLLSARGAKAVEYSKLVTASLSVHGGF